MRAVLSKLAVLALVCAVVTGCDTVGRAGRGVSESVAQTGLALGDRLGGDDAKLPELAPVADAITVELVWQARLTGNLPEGFPRLSPALTDELIVVAQSRTELRAYHLNDHTLRWTAKLPDPAQGGIGVAGGLVLVGTGQGQVIALNAQTGERLWTGQVSSEVLAPPAGDSSVIVAASGDGKLTGLSAVDGARKWVISREVPALSLRGGSAPLVTGGVVVHGFPNGRLVGAALRNGLEAWDTALALPRGRTELDRMVDVGAGPRERNGTVFAASYQGRIGAVGLLSGEQIWSRELSCYQPLGLDDFNVFATGADGKLLAFDQRTGLTYWENDTLQGRDPTGPAVVGRHVIVGDRLGVVHVLSADTGEPEARVQLGDKPFVFQGIERNGVVLMVAADGNAYAIRPAN